jgi:hypothetical protein
MPRNYTVNLKGEKQVAVKTTGYEKLCVPVMLCITVNGSKLPPYVILNRKTVPKENSCKDVIVRDDGVNGRLAWMCMETSAWYIIKATEYACSGCIL